MNNRERAERADEAYSAVRHDDNDPLTNIGDLMCDLAHLADEFVEWNIIDAYTNRKLDTYIAKTAEAALAQYSMDRGYGDPREAEPADNPFFPFAVGSYTRIAAVFENTNVYAEPISNDGWGPTMFDRALMHYKAEVAEEQEEEEIIDHAKAREIILETIHAENEASVDHNAYLDRHQLKALQAGADALESGGIVLTDEQRVFLCDLVSHDSDLIGDLVGYADEANGHIADDGWFQNLLNSTREALGTSREPRQHRAPTMTKAHQKMADDVLQGLERLQMALSCLEELGVNVVKERIAEDEPFCSTDIAIEHLKEAETFIENA